MNRTLVSLRDAVASDAAFLVDLWADSIRRADRTEQVADLEAVIKTAATSPEQRLLIADYDGHRAGAVFLRIGTVSPLNLEPTVWILSPHVAPDFQRKGVGRALMEAAVGYAEDNGVAHLLSPATAGSRDGNRFLARLGLGQHAQVRMAPTHTVRAKLNAQRPASQRIGGQRSARVLAVRRSMRRAAESAS